MSAFQHPHLAALPPGHTAAAQFYPAAALAAGYAAVSGLAAAANSGTHAVVSPGPYTVVYTTPRTWHPHIYDKPRGRPTRHSIVDILGDKEDSSCENYDTPTDLSKTRDHSPSTETVDNRTSSTKKSPEYTPKDTFMHGSRSHLETAAGGKFGDSITALQNHVQAHGGMDPERSRLKDSDRGSQHGRFPGKRSECSLPAVKDFVQHFWIWMIITMNV